MGDVNYHTHPAGGLPCEGKCYRAEFALDGFWFANAIRFDNAQDAVWAARRRFAVWIAPSDWRVASSLVDQKQPYLGAGDPTASTVVEGD